MAIPNSRCARFFAKNLPCMRLNKTFTCLAQILVFLSLAGCSTYPIPDDVIRISTEDIVRHARCEMRAAVIESIIDQKFAAISTEEDVVAFVQATSEKIKKIEKLNQLRDPRKAISVIKALTKSELLIQKYMGVAVVYSFDFNITENNAVESNAGFKLPFVSPSVFDLSANAALNLTRQGQRQFKAGDVWASMLVQKERCKDLRPRPHNAVYPLGGSIGIGRVVKTFIDISNQGGAKDSFVDTLIFTTEVAGGVNAAAKLNSVPHSFRLVSIDANLSARRLDVHKVIISLVFPRASTADAITGVDFFDGYLNAPFDRPPDWRARYNLCVADAREREDTFNTLRESPPEIYCISYADAFAPQYGSEVLPPRRTAAPRKIPQQEREIVPPSTTRRSLRPNRL